MICSRLAEELCARAYDKRLDEIYVDQTQTQLQRERYIAALEAFQGFYGNREVAIYSAPGRSEVGGNHTDHQKGKVLATAVNIDILAIAAKREDNIIRVISKGYEEVELDIADLEVNEADFGSIKGLTRGVLAGFKKQGLKIGGFDVYMESLVPQGAGLSSSAAFEVAIGNILSDLYNEGQVEAVTIAKIGQLAENIYFGKPCGLMDQMASSVGGLIGIDFKDTDKPKLTKIDVDFESFGYSLCIVDTKGSHANLTDEYAAIPTEMKKVAAYFGKEYLREVNANTFYQAIPDLRKNLGDRAVLRAIHWYNEEERVEAQIEALEDGDFNRFKSLIKESGDSSYKYLQNVYVAGNPINQEICIGLAMTENHLGFDVACRVHGGGFAGTIQVFVKNDQVEGYKDYIEQIFGKGACHVLKVRPLGGVKVV